MPVLNSIEGRVTPRTAEGVKAILPIYGHRGTRSYNKR